MKLLPNYQRSFKFILLIQLLFFSRFSAVPEEQLRKKRKEK